MNILVCNLYFNVPLDRSTTKGLPSTIRASYPDSSTKGMDQSIQNSTEHAATSTVEFKSVTTVATLKYTIDLTVTQEPNPEVANYTGKSNSSMNSTLPNGGKKKRGIDPMPVFFLHMIGGFIVLVLSLNIAMFIIWWATGKTLVDHLRDILPGRETGAESNAASMMSYDERVNSVGQNTRNRGPGNFNCRAKTRPSECSQETPSLSVQSYGSDTGPEEGDRLTHSYQGAIARAGENTSRSQLSAEPVGGTLSYSNNRGEFTSETTSHNQNREENNSITHLKQIKKPRGTLHEAQPLLGPLSSLRHYKRNSSKGCYNRNLAEKCQARVDLQLKINLPAKSRGMGVTYESAADPTTPDDDDLHFGITAVDDSNFVQAQQAQEDLEQKENTEQKRVV
ncbi:uncharacterized protein LOC106157505 [Lingula anatina]|uniref:Uncharacterized protein LOC106157505 n=1 Tax=Lingula anatina TaxID=7574 RepID=A0A1S3HRH6_LINAN|nr:uncharacterized protein LOC106157505 [Lingula anatina]|eukprot:XP_013388637.2 uncharacterized protein LOC106157505 [Lingula anatina]